MSSVCGENKIITVFEFTNPVYLLLLPAVIILYLIAVYSLTNFSKRQLRVHTAVRSGIFILLVLALAGMTLQYPSTAKQFVFLADKSKSVDENAVVNTEQFINGFERQIVTRRSCSVISFDENQNTTDIQKTMENGLMLLQNGKVPHFVLFSDGNENSGSVMQFIREHKDIPVSVIPLPTSQKPEVAVEEVAVPANIRQDEPFFVEIVIQSNIETESEVILKKNTEIILAETKSIHTGKNVFRFQQTAENNKPLHYTAEIKPQIDTLPENNIASGLSLSAPKPKILLIESEPAKIREFAAALQEQGFDIETADSRQQTEKKQSRSRKITENEYDNYDAVVFSNVPAKDFSPEQLTMLKEYVEVFGGGFLMLGGENSFGLGGYHLTPVEDILPVKCDIEDEDEKLPMAMCLVIDRSGSMGGEKMELAKEAVKSAIGLLQKKDFISIVAFDHASYLIAPLQSAENSQRIKSAVSTIEAAGGTNIYPALEDAYVQLSKANTKLKHIILLSDGYSVPGDYAAAVRKLTDVKITVSTVGVGDADNTLLKNIAEKGKGRHYTCVDPKSIPEIFAQETLAASKTSINEETFLPAAASPSNTLSGISLDTLPPLLGYIAVEAKPAAQNILLTETGDPLLVRQRTGLGTAAVFTSDVKSKWGSDWLTWKEFPKFWSQVLRQIIRTPEQRPEERYFSMKKQVYAGKVHLTLDALDENGQFINDGKGTLKVIKPDDTEEETQWQQTAPGRYETEFSAVQPGGYELQTKLSSIFSPFSAPRSSLSALPINYPDEFRLQETNTALLKEIAASSGGLYNPSADEILNYGSGRKTKYRIPLFPFLLSAAALLYVFDVFLKRVTLHKWESVH